MKKKFILLTVFVLIFYLISHLVNLTSLPVFADEAIYIRWAQLIIDDPSRYLFFSMNDGKTPLFIWLLTPFQLVLSDALLAGRLLSVLVGLFQVMMNGLILKELKVSPKSIWLGMILTALLPYWIIHHRLALMDGLLVLFASVAYLGMLRIINSKTKDKKVIASLMLALGFGMSLWSKLPAVLLVPVFYLPLIFEGDQNKGINLQKAAYISGSIGVGFGIFGLLAFHPSFGQLFSRGGDFLLPLGEVLFSGLWRETLSSLPVYAGYFVSYLTSPLIIILLMGLFSKKNNKRTHMLFWSGVIFILPIALLGKVVFPRYLFPAALFFTLAAASAADSLLAGWQKFSRISLAGSVFLVLLLANVITSSLQFMFLHLNNPDQTPFVSSDREQYLESWSSGHGIKEVVDLLLQQDSTTGVATEGYFGTLPDGLNMYLFHEDVSKLYVEGIGQPISKIPADFTRRADDFEQSWLVVNSDRLKMDLRTEDLIMETCRPGNSPCLQVWDISSLVKKSD